MPPLEIHGFAYNEEENMEGVLEGRCEQSFEAKRKSGKIRMACGHIKSFSLSIRESNRKRVG